MTLAEAERHTHGAAADGLDELSRALGWWHLRPVGHSDEWAARETRRYLVRVAQEGDGYLPTYGVVGAVCERHPLAVGRILEMVYADCVARGEPDLTVLVVNQKTRIPGKYGGRFAADGDMSQAAWRGELTRVRSWAWSDDTSNPP